MIKCDKKTILLKRKSRILTNLMLRAKSPASINSFRHLITTKREINNLLNN